MCHFSLFASRASGPRDSARECEKGSEAADGAFGEPQSAARGELAHHEPVRVRRGVPAPRPGELRLPQGQHHAQLGRAPREPAVRRGCPRAPAVRGVCAPVL